MPFTLTWSDAALRLLCTLIAGVLVGLDRDERGKAAGIRTNVLVCLAASVSATPGSVFASSIEPRRSKPYSVMRMTSGLLLATISGEAIRCMPRCWTAICPPASSTNLPAVLASPPPPFPTSR